MKLLFKGNKPADLWRRQIPRLTPLQKFTGIYYTGSSMFSTVKGQVTRIKVNVTGEKAGGRGLAAASVYDLYK